MKKKSTQSAIETHCLISRQFPAGPGSDLVNTNAIPYSPVPDVDKEMNCKPGEFNFVVKGKGGR